MDVNMRFIPRLFGAIIFWNEKKRFWFGMESDMEIALFEDEQFQKM
jgi:hypothetical protein